MAAARQLATHLVLGCGLRVGPLCCSVSIGGGRKGCYYNLDIQMTRFFITPFHRTVDTSISACGIFLPPTSSTKQEKRRVDGCRPKIPEVQKFDGPRFGARVSWAHLAEELPLSSTSSAHSGGKTISISFALASGRSTGPVHRFVLVIQRQRKCRPAERRCPATNP